MKTWLKDKLKDFVADCRQSWKSLTIWFNGVIGSIALFLPEVIAAFPQLQEYLPETTYKTWTIVLLVGNFILRFRTTKALRNK